MDVNETIEIFRRIYDRAMNHGDTELVYEMYSSAFACSNPDYKIDGYEDIEASVRNQRAAFPDIDFRVMFICGSEDGIAICWKLRGTHTRELWGLPPSGRFLEMNGITVHELYEGKSVGGYSCSDMKDKMVAAYAQAESEGTVPVAS